jgi:DNA polymerase-3 subunit alpha
MYLIFDTETTGLPQNYSAPVTDLDNWPRAVQLAWQLHDHTGKYLSGGNYIIRPDGFTIPFNAEKVHGISTSRAMEEGHPLEEVLHRFNEDLNRTTFVIGHNINFDEMVMGAEFIRAGVETPLLDLPKIDTKDDATDYCKIPGGRGGGFKWPTLTELHQKLFGEGFDDAHDAAADVEATTRAFLELVRIGVIQVTFPADTGLTAPSDSYIVRDHYIDFESPTRLYSEKKVGDIDRDAEIEKQAKVSTTELKFVHLHNHSKYSVLQATSGVDELAQKAADYGMKAVALTDLGNMYGAFAFVRAAERAGVKPIVGCEFYVVEDRHKKKFTKDHKDKRYQVPLLAKNLQGYKNLAKLSSLAFTEGYYYKFPRIDRELIKKYSSDLICLSGGLLGEIADLALNRGIEYAEEALLWWKDIFGEDFYLEINNHGLEEEKAVIEIFRDFSAKHGVKLVATNNTFYLNKVDADAHDALLCIDNGELVDTPVGKGRGFRYGFPNHEFYFKSAEDMQALFPAIPEALSNTIEIADKVESYTLARDVILPNFELPEGFESEDEYLRHLAFEGASERYDQIEGEVEGRIEHELQIIKSMGFAGYFLIVQDFIAAARNMGVFVGPGRGSAAGSVVAYCIGITNIDPIRYDLLFERFLNPERVSMPDIDIDFDDEGRQKVIDYVVDKYGKNQVAHIITFGSMAARSSVRDVARVLDLPLPEADRIAKLVPERPGTTLDQAFQEVKELVEIEKGDDKQGNTLKMARVLEGSIRNTGIHAAGVIIAPDDLTEFIPVSTAKDADLVSTQFDGSVIEDAGMLKMDFLGLKTLSILKTAIQYVKDNHGKEYHLDDIPLDDENTFKLYQKGGTIGTFQFESDGMRKYLKDLKPTNINDLIAMNALYRPGPMQFIPDYIKRKHGKEDPDYPHELIQDILEPTFGIMIYQEQIMNVAQKLAGYSLGQADLLRRAMGKKKREVMEAEKPKFIEGASKNGVDEKTALNIFDKMEMFASYGFNKSHSAAYSVVAYQTMYFKANYPAEYMAAVLSHNMKDIKKVSFFIEESARMGIAVDAPNVNTGESRFVVKDGRIQYGLAAIKGVGEQAIEEIVQAREEAPFSSIFDFVSKVDPKICNKKTLESLMFAGAFDSIDPNRAQLVESMDDILAYGARIAEEKRLNQASLFGGASTGGQLQQQPKLRPVQPWTTIERLNKEREYIGFYLSGHPLDRYKDDIELFSTHKLISETLSELPERTDAQFIAIITAVRKVTDRKGRPFAFIQAEDQHGTIEIIAFSETYDRHMGILQVDNVLLMNGYIDNKSGQPKLIANSFERVENLREKFANKLVLRLSIDTAEITQPDLEQIATLFSVNKGETTVKFKIKSSEAKRPFSMNVRKFVVDPNDDLLKSLREILDERNVLLSMN